jgi:hypothetical protein
MADGTRQDDRAILAGAEVLKGLLAKKGLGSLYDWWRSRTELITHNASLEH